MVPFGDGVACFAGAGTSWQVHDGKAWWAVQKGPFAVEKGAGTVSLTSLDRGRRGRLFAARAAAYDNGGKSEPLAALEVVMLGDGGWGGEKLEETGVSDAMLSASGEAVFCFYVKKAAADKYEVRFRRWKDGKWETSELVATETERVNHVAVPQFCPPDYAAVFWDQWTADSKKSAWVRFARIPNK
jgi:hypothetical protein